MRFTEDLLLFRLSNLPERLVSNAATVVRSLVPLAATFLAACTGDNPGLTDLQRDVARTEWMAVASEDAWIDLPQTLLVLERSFEPISEQRVLLPNHTTLPGDNFIYLRAEAASSLATAGMLRLRRVLAQAGGLPSPFTEAELEVLRSGEDMAGTLIWAEWESGADTTCVLATRRLDVTDRLLPDRAVALDILMRNCVHGDVEMALEPAGGRGVMFSAPEGMASGAPVRTLSPLAAPAL